MTTSYYHCSTIVPIPTTTTTRTAAVSAAAAAVFRIPFLRMKTVVNKPCSPCTQYSHISQYTCEFVNEHIQHQWISVYRIWPWIYQETVAVVGLWFALGSPMTALLRKLTVSSLFSQTEDDSLDTLQLQLMKVGNVP